jgi:hypothetical protein
VHDLPVEAAADGRAPTVDSRGCAMAHGSRPRAEELALPVDELLPVDRDRLTSDQNGAVAVEMETRCFETGALQPAKLVL